MRGDVPAVRLSDSAPFSHWLGIRRITVISDAVMSITKGITTARPPQKFTHYCAGGGQVLLRRMVRGCGPSEGFEVCPQSDRSVLRRCVPETGLDCAQ